MLSDIPVDDPAAPVARGGHVDLRALALVVVEDDEGDALLLAATLQDSGIPEAAVRWYRTLADARAGVAEAPADCVLVDLGLPDASGLESVQAMTATIDTAVIVLTGLSGRSGQPALAAGAQDFLVKDDLQAETLSRAIRYAVERKLAERTQRELAEIRQQSQENGRLERGLLPRPILGRAPGRAPLGCATTYRAGRGHTLLGGDFYDVIERDDGSVRALIADVMGHGADEAALGVHLRVAWRALVLAGIPDPEVLAMLDTVLIAEQAPGHPFVTALDVTIHPDRRGATLRSAGHPAPVLLSPDRVWQPDMTVLPPLGIGALHGAALGDAVELGWEWSMLLYTDGLLDSFRDHDDITDIGFAGLLRAATEAASPAPQQWLDGVVARVPGAVTDDMAVVALAARSERPR